MKELKEKVSIMTKDELTLLATRSAMQDEKAGHFKGTDALWAHRDGFIYGFQKAISLLHSENREVVSDDSHGESSVLHDVREWNATIANDAGSETSVESALGKRIETKESCCICGCHEGIPDVYVCQSCFDTANGT